MPGVKKINLLLIPEKAEKVAHIRVPVFSPRWMIALFLFIVTGFGLFIHDYRNMRNQIATLSHLEKEQGQQTMQLLHLADLTVQMSEETKGLQEKTRRGLYREDWALEETPSPWGMGGSGLGLLGLGFPSKANISGLVRLMHLSLDKLDEEIGALEFAGAEAEISHRDDLESAWERNDPVKSDIEMIHRELTLTAYELGLDPRLAFGIAKVESGFDPSQISPKGAIGVLQIMPQFVPEEHGVSREMLFDPKVNIRIGLLHIKALLDRFDQNLDLSLAAYNAGASRVIKAGLNIPPIKETQAYVKKVKKAMRSWEDFSIRATERGAY
jgi:hypothetical protein